MLTERAFIKKHKTTCQTVHRWVREELIPGVFYDGSGHLYFPESARRPYRARCGKHADVLTVCASVVNACIRCKQICGKTYGMTEREFLPIIRTLIDAGLLAVRIEDGITYYNAALRCSVYRKAAFCELKKFVSLCLQNERPLPVAG